jgi:hypothetical protein
MKIMSEKEQQTEDVEALKALLKSLTTSSMLKASKHYSAVTD